jgi:L-aminopeptidase/D-esterase-like protein
VVARRGAVVGVDVRGAAPGTRETDLCRPGTLIEQAHSVLLTGGSAFGLDAAGGVMRYLHERGIGFPVGNVVVPIVPAAVIFDLSIGLPVWPDAAMAYRACVAASSEPPLEGSVGAGMGATVGKVLGPEHAMKSGVGTASVRVGGATVGALVVVNAFGHVTDPASGRRLAGARDAETGAIVDTVEVLVQPRNAVSGERGGNTTIGVIATDAPLDKAGINRLCSLAHDGLARCISPVHTQLDGDTIFGLATGETGPAEGIGMMALEVAVVRVVEEAVVRAVSRA